MPIRGGISLKKWPTICRGQIPLDTMPSPYNKKIVKKIGKILFQCFVYIYAKNVINDHEMYQFGYIFLGEFIS
jgi:hypothetical protein